MTRSKESGYRWIILTVNFVFLAFAYASLTTWSVAIPELSKTFSLSPAKAQLGSSLLMAGYAIGSFVESLLASRIGLKKTGLLAAILLLAPQFAIPLLGHYSLILLLRCLQGWGVMWFVTTSMTTAWFPLEQRGMASGIVSGAIPFGIGFGGLLTGRLLEVAGTWQRTFIEFGIVVTMIALVWTLLARDPADVTPQPSSDAVMSPAPLFSPFGSLVEWLVALCLFANAWQLIRLNTVLPSYMYSLGYHPTQAGAAILAVGLMGVVSTPLGGVISDRLILRGVDPVKARAYVMDRRIKSAALICAGPGVLVDGKQSNFQSPQLSYLPEVCPSSQIVLPAPVISPNKRVSTPGSRLPQACRGQMMESDFPGVGLVGGSSPLGKHYAVDRGLVGDDRFHYCNCARHEALLCVGRFTSNCPARQTCVPSSRGRGVCRLSKRRHAISG